VSYFPSLNLARKHWPHYFQQPREYYTEEQIVDDLYNNVMSNVFSFSYIVNGTKESLKKSHDKTRLGKAIQNYYAMHDVEFPLPEGYTVPEYSLHILHQVWERVKAKREEKE
jgi:hypothetical protein